MQRFADLRINDTAASLLGFLHHGPASGWDLAKRIDASIGNFWNVTQSQVYRELKSLTDAALISLVAERNRASLYAITARGREAFSEWVNTEPGANLIRLPAVTKVFFGRHVEPAALAQFIENKRISHLQQLAQYKALQSQLDSEFELATLDLGIAYEMMMIDWLSKLPWRTSESSAKKRRPRKRTAGRR